MSANEKLASALDELKELQAHGSRVFASSQLRRVTRERLVRHGFLREVMKGWLVASSPATLPGDTTPWFATFWEFCRRYCEARFGRNWHLSPEQSLLCHAENTVVPKQLVVHSPDAGNNRIELLFESSFFALRVKTMPPEQDLEAHEGLRVYGVVPALVRVTEDFFGRYPIEAGVLLSGIREPSALLVHLLQGGHAVVAGRLAGAFRHLGDDGIANEIVAVMKAADHDVRESDPFVAARPPPPLVRSTPPIVARLRAQWASSRDAVLAAFPPPPARPQARAAYLRQLDQTYELDAYHSLSIEGYQVTPELIARVAAGDWNPDKVAADRDSLNALAARGYWQAFQRVREAVSGILAGEDGPELMRSAHRDWYRELFGPYVAAGALPPAALAGYRNQPVYLRGSRHVPPRWELLGEAMPALFDLIEAEPEAAVRAVVGHWLFGYIHPFPDGNGRIARFVMNALLATGGYPWTVIRSEDRIEYLESLERASVDGDIRSFAAFVARQMSARSRRTRRR